MSTQYDKLLVTHAGALRRKYAASGAASVRTALDALVAADAGRGLVSRVPPLDNATSMRAVGAAVVAEGDWVATVRAVDLAGARYQPSYVALVGARDVVPQARLRNPLAGVRRRRPLRARRPAVRVRPARDVLDLAADPARRPRLTCCR